MVGAPLVVCAHPLRQSESRYVLPILEVVARRVLTPQQAEPIILEALATARRCPCCHAPDPDAQCWDCGTWQENY